MPEFVKFAEFGSPYQALSVIRWLPMFPSDTDLNPNDEIDTRVPEPIVVLHSSDIKETLIFPWYGRVRRGDRDHVVVKRDIWSVQKGPHISEILS